MAYMRIHMRTHRGTGSVRTRQDAYAEEAAAAAAEEEEEEAEVEGKGAEGAARSHLGRARLLAPSSLSLGLRRRAQRRRRCLRAYAPGIPAA